MKSAYLPRPSSEVIQTLPEFAGLPRDQIELVDELDDLTAVRTALLQASALGFDTESKPTFKIGEVSTGPHLVQLSTPDRAYLFRLRHPAANQLLAEVIQARQPLKVGFGLKSDVGPLQHRLGVEMHGRVELSKAVKQLGFKDPVGLKMAVAIVLKRRIQKSKRVTTSNWAASCLTEDQLRYAANDAYASLMIYLALATQQP